MENLNEHVNKVMEGIDEEYHRINSLQQQVDELYQKSSEKIYKTAEALKPLMEKIRENRHYFRGVDTTYISKRGPVLKHDTKEDELYLFDVEKMAPITVNLYNDEVKVISYRKLLDEVKFTNIMDSLLLVMEHHNAAQQEYEKAIADMEEQLNQY